MYLKDVDTVSFLDHEVLDLHTYIAWNPEVKRFKEVATLEEFHGLLKEMSAPVEAFF